MTNDNDFAKQLWAFQPKLLYWCTVKCHLSQDKSEDMVQSTFLAAWGARDRFDGANLGAWLFTILKNKIRSSMRRRTMVELDALEGFEPRAPDNPYYAAELGATIREMAKLPRHYQDILVVGARGLRQREMAEALGLEEGTVKSRQARARTALSNALNAGPRKKLRRSPLRSVAVPS